MAFTPVYVVLLTLLGVTSSCVVTCSTDYEVLLNCSCVPDSVLTHPLLVEVNCSLRDDNLSVLGSCQVKPPQPWCIMYPKDLSDVASVGAMCFSKVGPGGDQVQIEGSESSSWELSEVVKPPPPHDVQVTNVDGFYNITWDHEKKQDSLTYRVRIRASKHLSTELAKPFLRDKKYILLDRKKLSPHVNYTVDIQAKMSPENLYHGPWSEWSSAARWTTPAMSSEIEVIWLYVLLPVILIIGLLLLGYSQKPFLQKRIQLYTYVSRPDEFFKPLYHTYGGNFKEWVKPVYGEYDYFGNNAPVEMLSEKQHDVLHRNNKKQGYSEDDERKRGDFFLHILQPDCNPLLHVQDDGGSQGTTGHISIHTVTLSGEEGFDEDIMSQSSSNRSYEDGESLSSYRGDHAGYDLEEPQTPEVDRKHKKHISNHLSQQNINLQAHVQFSEPERVSLDSFASTEQSEDGYPPMDLDTMDSGFGECGSPRASDSNTAELTDLFHEHKHSDSNYVKQWMTCSTIEEDSGNSADN